MKLYKTTITPISNFITTLKGDTIFGQMCWAIRYKYGEDRLIELLSNYENRPFLIVSDGFTKGFIPKPKLPSLLLNESIEDKKLNRKKVWITIDELKDSNFQMAREDSHKEVNNSDTQFSVVKNSINYKTFATEGDGFDPYGENEISFSKKDIYFLMDNSFTLEELIDSFKLLSEMGYGKDATIGKGRFQFDSFEEVFIENKSDAYMTLSPSILSDMDFKECFYEPFTRFGKHGASLANNKPFKKPIILADTAAVVRFKDEKEFQFIGKSINSHSSNESTVHQGYSIVLPMKGLDYGK